jgi:succinoglycan biosynthesis protein ExoA
MPSSALPPVSVIMPVRNEAAFIGRSLGAVLDQDYPADRMEIIVIDDGSTDDTRGVIAGLPGADRVRVIDGPGGCVPAALNRGIDAAQGVIVVRVDGHNIIAPDYVRRSVDALLTHNADNAGGRWIITGGTPTEQAIAAGMRSPFGVGSAAWRHSPAPAEVDTVPFGAYRREALIALGGFDERLIRNQDYELNWRLRAAGGRIYYDPAIVSTYNVKRDWRGLWKQYYQYGVWKARVIRMHPRSARWRHFVAPALVAGLAGGGLLGVFNRWGRWLLALATVGYALAVMLAAGITAAREGREHLPRLPLVFVILHISWGIGFWRGLALPPLVPLPLPDSLYDEPPSEYEIPLD